MLQYFKRYFAKLICAFIPIKSYRQKIRQRIENRFHTITLDRVDSFISPKICSQINNFSNEDFLVLKGIEYDTIDAGHVLVIMPETIKLRILELRGLPVQLLIDIVHQRYK